MRLDGSEYLQCRTVAVPKSFTERYIVDSYLLPSFHWNKTEIKQLLFQYVP